MCCTTAATGSTSRWDEPSCCDRPVFSNLAELSQELLRQAGVTYRDLEQAGVYFVVARCAARFHAPARYDDVLKLTTEVGSMGRARIDHTYRLCRKGDGLLLATAEITIACVDADGRLQPIPESVRGDDG